MRSGEILGLRVGLVICATTTIGFLNLCLSDRLLLLQFVPYLTPMTERTQALEQLRKHKITIRRAAEIARVDYPEMLELASETGIDVGGYTTNDLLDDLNRL